MSRVVGESCPKSLRERKREGEVPVPLLPHTGTHGSIYWALPNVVKLTQFTARNPENGGMKR